MFDNLNSILHNKPLVFLSFNVKSFDVFCCNTWAVIASTVCAEMEQVSECISIKQQGWKEEFQVSTKYLHSKLAFHLFHSNLELLSCFQFETCWPHISEVPCNEHHQDSKQMLSSRQLSFTPNRRTGRFGVWLWFMIPGFNLPCPIILFKVMQSGSTQHFFISGVFRKLGLVLCSGVPNILLLLNNNNNNNNKCDSVLFFLKKLYSSEKISSHVWQFLYSSSKRPRRQPLTW